MAIDIRATVTCSLGTLISGSVSDDYLQGSGLIKTKGSVEISGTITPAIGTVVTFSYVKGGVTRSIPRKLRVMSSFADPFRRTTQVELGCKLTYLSDLKDPIDWDAFDDPENSEYTEEDDRIVTLPIYASSVMSECLSKLGISASSVPLTNAFSVATFDFSAGYVSVLSDLLVSESYFGYLDTSEVLQVRNLNASGGTGPVFTSTDIVDLGPIGVGQLPGEAVTVSYSTLKLKEPAAAEDEEETQKFNWERDETIGIPTTVFIANPFADALVVPSPPDYFEYTYIPKTISETFYDLWNRVTKRVTTNYTILADIAPSYIQYKAAVEPQAGGQGSGSIEVTTVSTEQFIYELQANTIQNELPEGYDKVISQTTTGEEPLMKLYGSTGYYNQASAGTVTLNLLTGNFVAEKSITTYDNATTANVDVTKTITEQYLCHAYTQKGQQEIAAFFNDFSYFGSEDFFNKTGPVMEEGERLVPLGTDFQITTGNSVGLQQRPSSADRTNAEYADEEGDPNNGWRVESSGELELAVGSATAQRRIELAMPYAPDDRFSGPTGGPFIAIPSDAPQKAIAFGRIQNRLLLGNRNGMNLQLSPERIPTAPFDPLYVQANGLTAIYRANGTSWAFDSSGIVTSIDALFWAAVGGTGTFWFPVAPGITTLPTTPAIVDGTMNATTVVLPYNETAAYNGILRTRLDITKFDYSLTLLTVIDPITITVGVSVAAVIVVPSVNISLASHTPAVLVDVGVQVPVGLVAITAHRPYAQNLSIAIPVSTLQLSSRTPYVNNLRAGIPAAQISLAAQAPTLLTIVNVSAITYAQSSTWSDTTAASNAIMTDQSFTNTGAATDTANPAWIRMDLGGSTHVGTIVVGTATSNIPGGWDKSYTENKNLQYSQDSTTWTTATNTGTLASNGIYTFSVDFKARYIRIATTSDDFVAASEFYALAPGQSYP